MKLHLPITLLTAVLAAVIALPAQAVEAPKGYTTIYLNSTSELGNYSSLTAAVAFIVENSLELSPTSNDYWTSSTPLISGGNVFFGSYNSDSPVALSFKDGYGPAFYGQGALTFDTLSNLTFSTIRGNIANGTLTITNVNDGQSDTVDVLFKNIENTSSSSEGGAIDASTVTISNNGDVSFSRNSTHASSASSSYYSDGGAIYAVLGLTISHNGDVSFSGNSTTATATSAHSSSEGGAIWTYGLTISYNGDVSFSGNSTSATTSASADSSSDDPFSDDSSSDGGAIYAINGLTISYNGDVSFSGNSTTSTSASSYADGGAISAIGADVIISHNGDVSFSRNSTSANSTSADSTHALSEGGAIYTAYGLTISHNGDVSFSGNSASANSTSANSAAAISGGGAIYALGGLTISHNGDVSFSGNSTTATATSADSYSFSDGGAIYDGHGLTISHNGDVSFSGNSAHTGGAIYARQGLTISHNGDVSFSGNSAHTGGAIYADYGDVTIQGNDSVLFEKNYEKDSGEYQLWSIYSLEDMALSAKTGGNITFNDTVYTARDTYINSDYTDAEGNTTSAKGDVIFSGKYAEQHLNEILAANNENRTATAKEILNSQTSVIRGNVYVNGGSMQIVDGAVLKVNGNTVSIAEGSEATLAISDAELVAENATIEVEESTTLQLSNGASVTADEINIAAGATLAIGDIAVTTSAIDSMVAAYRLSSLNVINADLTFAAGSTLVTDGIGINMTEGSILTFNATSDGEKINLVFTLGTEYSEDGLVQLFSNVDIVKFLMDGEEVDSSTTLLASDFFTGTGINENTTLHYDSTANVVYLQGVNNVVPEPTTATLSLLALAALAMRRRRK